MLATALVLVAALLHAAWNTLIKFSAERLLVVACMDSVALLFGALALGFVALPPLEIWPWILASAAFELLYRYLLIQAYRVGDLGLVYPLMRGLSPLVVLALTLIFAGEVLTSQQIIGILLIPFGMLCLLWQGGGGERLPWSMLPVVALIGLCIGCYTFIDGHALRRWPHPLDYLVWVTLLSAGRFRCWRWWASDRRSCCFGASSGGWGWRSDSAYCSATLWCCGPCNWGRSPKQRRCGRSA